MSNRVRLLGLIALILVLIAFVVSFVLGFGEEKAPVALPGVERPVPGLNSGRRVEVLNTSGRSGLARNATEQLRAAGYDVVFFGNAGARVDTLSTVIDRVGKIDLAKSVADKLGIAKVQTEIDSTRLVEVSVFIGRDWPPTRR